MEELIVSVNVSGEDNLSNLDTNLNKVTESSKKTVNAFTAMRKEVRDAKATMLSAAEGSDEYNAAMLRAAEAADKMRDMNDKIKMSQKDIGVVAKNVAGTISGMAGAFATAEGVIGLFGAESEATTKAILKIQQVMAVTSGIAQMADAMDNIKDVYGALKLGIMSMIAAKTVETTTTVANTAANVAEAGAITATGVAATVSARQIMIALGPIGLVIAAVGLLTAGIMYLIEKTSEVPTELKIDVKFNEQVVEKLVSNFEKSYKFAVDYNAAVKEGNKSRMKELEQVGVKEFNLNKLTLGWIGDNVDAWRAAFYEYIEMAKRTYKEEILIKNLAMSELTAEQDAIDLNNLQTKKDQIMQVIKAQKQGAYVIREALEGGTEIKPYWTKEIIYLNSLSREINTFTARMKVSGEQAYQAKKKLDEFEKKNPPIKPEKSDIKIIDNKKPEPTKKEQTLKKGVIKSEFVPEVAPTIVGLKEFKSSSEEFIQINNNMTNSDIASATELDIIKQKKGKSRESQLAIEKNYYKKALAEANQNYAEARSNYDAQKKLYDDEVKSLNQKVVDYNDSYQKEINIQIDYKNKIAANKQEMANIETQFAEAKTKADKDALQARYNKLNENNALNENELKQSENSMKALENKKQEISTGTEAVGKIGDKVKDASQKVIDANNKIVESNAFLAENSKTTWGNIYENVQKYGDIAGGVFDAIANYNKAEIDSNNAKYDDNAKLIEDSNMSEDEKTAALKKNEQERYKENKKAFETQKAFQIASAIASGAVSIAKTWEGYAGMGIPGAILASIQTAIIAANTIAQIKTIKAQRMDAPSESSTTESSTSKVPTANVYQALTPTSNSLTSSQENLNMMSAASQKNVETVVRISDIDKIQNKVIVRETNSSY